MAKEPRGRKKKTEVAPASRGLAASSLVSDSPPAHVEKLAATIEVDGGSVVGAFKDPLGGHWQILAGVPIEKVEPTPFQRDLSEAHVTRLADAIDKLDRYLDPVIAVRTREGMYWTPNGYHRSEAVRRLGGRSILALVVPDEEVARRVLALNTEKAHNLREKALEVIRLAETLVDLESRPERDYELEFEEPSLLTLGLCYQEKARFSGGAYRPVLKRVDEFLETSLPSALATRRERARQLLELDAAVNEAVARLKERGFESAYLKAFVVARINPLRSKRGVTADFDETIDKMLESARRFDASQVEVDQIAGAPGPQEE